MLFLTTLEAIGKGKQITAVSIYTDPHLIQSFAGAKYIHICIWGARFSPILVTLFTLINNQSYTEI